VLEELADPLVRHALHQRGLALELARRLAWGAAALSLQNQRRRICQ
jgi:hypothetical protein